MATGLIIGFFVFIYLIVKSLSKAGSNQQSEKKQRSPIVHKPKGSARWVSKDDNIILHGISIKDGMFYYGDYLPSLNGSSIEPALINPNLPINKSSPDIDGSTMSYWPSYSNISPEARAAYLNWLSTGRCDPLTKVGYVFLFFYGLERRALYDVKEMPEAREEIPFIISEISRLINIYGSSSGSFRGYATSLLNYLCSSYPQHQIDPIDLEPTSYGEIPFSLKKKIGQLSLAGKPIPASLALSWFERCPNISLRTPARRCRDEFVKLFNSRYHSEFGEGIVIKPNVAILSCDYKPASSSFWGQPFSCKLDGIPDITKLSRPISTFQKIVDTCTEDLEAYSRSLGRKSENNEVSILALSQLPTELLRNAKNDKIQRLLSYLQDEIGQGNHKVIELSGLLKTLGLLLPDGPLTQSDSLLIAQLLSRLGFGLEPDVRFGGSKIIPSEKGVIFKLTETSANAASPEYYFAALLLSFSSLIIHADGTVSGSEETVLRSHISSILSLTNGEKQRLDALLVYLCTAPPIFSKVKKRVDALKDDSKAFILKFLIAVANADGNIDPSEIKILKKVYELFGKESNQIYSDIHSYQTTGDSPVIIAPAQSTVTGFAIPPKKVSHIKGTGVALNMDLVEKTMQQTYQVQSLLSNIFCEQEETSFKPSVKQPVNANLIANLDAGHSELFIKLSSLESITIDGFYNLCKQISILPSGAIEMINNVCFDKVNDLYIEENEDILILNKEIAKEVLA